MKYSKHLDLQDYKNAIEIDLTGKLTTNNLFQGFLSDVSENSQLKTLNLSRNIFSESQLKRLQKSFNPHCQLEELNLSRTSLSPRAIPYIIGLMKLHPQLKVLKLADNSLGGKFKRFNYFKNLSEALKELKQLSVLDLSSNDINSDKIDTLLKEIVNHTSLLTLDLSKNQFDAYGAKRIGEFLQNNHTLLTLSVAYNRDEKHRPSTFFGRQFTLLIKPIFLALKNHNRSLTKLDIEGIELDIADLTLLKEVVVENKQMTEVSVVGSCEKQDANSTIPKLYEDIKNTLQHNNANDDGYSLVNI